MKKERLSGNILNIFMAFCLLLSGCSGEPDVISGKALVPAGDEIIYAGTVYSVRWSSAHYGRLTISLGGLDNPDLALLASDEPPSGSFSWEVPEDLPAGMDYQLHFRNMDAGEIQFSSGRFQIREPDETGSFTDPRDGEVYRTVKLGEQWWMSENFRYNCKESRLYKGKTENLEIYGRLYTYQSALENAPEGWHLPSDREWKELESYMGMPESERERFGKRGGFSGRLLLLGGGSGFNSEAGGYYNSCVGKFGHKIWEAHIWTSDKTREGKPILRIITEGTGEIIRLASICHGGSSVRYLMDKSSPE